MRKIGMLFSGNDLDWVKDGQNEDAIAEKILENMAWIQSQWKNWSNTEIVFVDCVPEYSYK